MLVPMWVGEGNSLPENETRTAEVDIAFKAGFLRPGVPASSSYRPEMVLDKINWTSGHSGLVVAQMWGVNALIEFTASPERDRIEIIHINPLEQGGSPSLWDVWRHRHGILTSPEGYAWNSTQEEKERLANADGVFYDRFLKGVWTYWALKKLPRHIKNPLENSAVSGLDQENLFVDRIRVRYDANGLKEPVALSMRIHVWDMPVLLAFNVAPSSATAANPAPGMTYKVRWTYDLDNWRQRHGYKKDLWGYDWRSGYPAETPLTGEQGKSLDVMLDRSVAYWVDVVAEQLMADLEFKISQLPI